MKAAEWDSYWNRPYSKYENHQRWFWEQVYPFLKGKILDVGCGPASMWKDTDYDVTGIDYSASAIEEAKKNHPKGIFHVADLRTYPPEPFYDCVIACGVAHYFDEDLVALKNLMVRSSKDLVIVTLNRDWELSRFRDWGKLLYACFKDRVGWVLVFRVIL